VKLMCQVLDVTRGGYYAWRDRPPTSARRRRRAELIEQIRSSFDDSRGSYGSPRLCVELREQGVAVCENTVAKYMRETGLFVKP